MASRKAKPKHAGGRPPKAPRDRLSTQLGVRADAETVDRLERLAARLGGLASRAAIARAALRVGLKVLESDPSKLLGEEE